MLSSMHAIVKRCSGMKLLALSLLLAGCATTSPPCVPDSPQIHASPALLQPLPSETYSSVAARTIEQWRKSLTGTPATSKP